ncbi:MAG: tetratricopeptide repeat protein [Flavobacteriaceae bacterium]|nr:tetratricopeptide repeat protein [Flavobacteriaceae bacterium]
MKKQAEQLNNEGVKLFLGGKFKDAKLKYQQALKIEPNYPTSLNNLGMICLQEKDFKRAEHNFKAANSEKENATYVLNLGHAYANQNQKKEAEESYLQSIKLNPDSLMAWKSLATLYQFEKKFKKSAQTWEYILHRLDKDNYFRIQLAKDYMEFQAYQNALDVLQEALNYKGHEALIWHYTALIHFNSKNFGNAEIAIKKSLSFAPNSEKSRVLAASICLGLANLTEALTHWNFILKCNENNHDVRIDKAVALMAHNLKKEALQELDYVISRNKNQYKALFYKAVLYMEMKDHSLETMELLKSLTSFSNEFQTRAKELLIRLKSENHEK